MDREHLVSAGPRDQHREPGEAAP
ncbi:unnamed protein product [Linum tenue]|uniref:Uncharacterized protein n=1 Tax=Linum tenue TaxID=586396 RepID=A0AAV0KHW7_9ROSI|nr:unnamed protein product [Linum tenue]